MTTLLKLMMNLNTGDDDSQELAIPAVEEVHQLGHNAVGDSFNFSSPKFSMARKRRLLYLIKVQVAKIIEIHQTLPLAEQKLQDAKDWVATLRMELAQAKEKVDRCRRGIDALIRVKLAIKDAILVNRLSIQDTNVCMKSRAFV